MEVSQDKYTEEYYLSACEGYREYLETKGEKPSSRLASALEAASIRPGMTVLDVGAGRGETLVYCAKMGAFATGIDYSEASIKLAAGAAEGHAGARVVRADACFPPFRDHTFDRILFLDIVEHLSARQLDRMYTETRRILKKDGMALIHTAPNKLAMNYGYPVKRTINNLVAMLVPDKAARRLFGGPPRRLPRDGRELLGSFQELHINEQSYYSLKKQLIRNGFKVELSLKPEHHNVGRFGKLTELWPLSACWPLNRFFAMHIWAVARPVADK